MTDWSGYDWSAYDWSAYDFLYSSSDDDFEEEVNDREEEVSTRVRKRYIRDGHNPFEFYSEKEFKRRFRFTKECVMYGLLDKVEESLAKANRRGLPIPPVIQLLICLRFYATASFQLVLGDIMTVSQSTVSRTIFRVSALLASHIHRIIKMPSTETGINENRELFHSLGCGREGIGLRGIDGVIDCTHIRLTQTAFNGVSEDFRNRKGWFSLNVQVVAGPRMEILDIVPQWPGKQHDSRIFQMSRCYKRFNVRELTGLLVGDNGYPSLPFLLTPYLNPTTEEQKKYNIIHRKTRQVIERTFGVWKRRFPCLSRGLSTKLFCSTAIIVACAVLHNLSLMYDNELPEDESDDIDHDDSDSNSDLENVASPHWQPADGFIMRDALVARLFG